MTNNHISLTLKIFLYFIIFAFLLVLVFWVLAIAVLDQFYAESKKQNCYEVAEKIEENLKVYNIDNIEDYRIDIRERFREFEIENDMNIWLVKKDQNYDRLVSYIYGSYGTGSSTINQYEIERIWDSIDKSNMFEYFVERQADFVFSKIITLNDKTEILLVLVSRIVPINTIVQVWRRQLYIISIVIVVLTALRLLSLFSSLRLIISTP